MFGQHAGNFRPVPLATDCHQSLTNLRPDHRVSKEPMSEHTRELYRFVHTVSKKGIKNILITRY